MLGLTSSSAMVFSRKALATPLLLTLAATALALDPQSPELVSVRWDSGEPSTGVCGAPRFSRNNRFLAFGCAAGDIVPGDTNNRADSFLLDRGVGTVVRVSVSSLGQEMPYDSLGGISDEDGGRVVFVGFGPLHPDYGAPPPLDAGRGAIYLRRPMAGQTDLISRTTGGVALAASANLWDAMLSSKEVLFSFRGDPRVSPLDNPAISTQLWVLNWSTGVIELISRTPDGSMSNGGGILASFSTDGRYVVFVSGADDLGPPAVLGHENLYWHDRQTGTIERLSQPWNGGEFIAPIQVGPTPPRVSRDGRYVFFTTNSAEVHPESPGDGGTYAYLLDRQGGGLEFISQTPGYPSFNTWQDISDDGRYLAWASRNSVFLGPPNPPPDMRAIWVLDRETGQRVNVTAPLGPLYEDSAISLDLSQDGSNIAFSWRIADPASSVFARPLLYTVGLRGTQPPPPATPVPTLNPFSMILLAGLALSMGYLAVAKPRRP